MNDIGNLHVIDHQLHLTLKEIFPKEIKERRPDSYQPWPYTDFDIETEKREGWAYGY